MAVSRGGEERSSVWRRVCFRIIRRRYQIRKSNPSCIQSWDITREREVDLRKVESVSLLLASPPEMAPPSKNLSCLHGGDTGSRSGKSHLRAEGKKKGGLLCPLSRALGRGGGEETSDSFQEEEEGETGWGGPCTKVRRRVSFPHIHISSPSSTVRT